VSYIRRHVLELRNTAAKLIICYAFLGKQG